MNGCTHLDETPPLHLASQLACFCVGLDEYTGDMLSKVSDEVIELRRVLLEKYPTLDLSDMLHLKDILLRYYYDDIGDKTNIYTMLKTSNAHRGLTHPMVEVETPEGKKGYLPNFKCTFCLCYLTHHLYILERFEAL